MQSFNRLYNIVISAVCMGLAQHPLGLGWLAWFSLVPLFIAIRNQNKFLKLCLDIFIWGFIYHLISLFWLSDNIGVDDRYVAFITMLLANLVCTFNVLIVFLIWHTINNFNNKKVWIALPFIWTMVDYLMSLTEVSFPWASIANTHAQEYLLSFVQFIEFTGMFGVTFWLVLLNVSLFYLYDQRSSEKIIDSFAIFIFPLIISFLLSNNRIEHKEKIIFTILQPNISIHDKNNNLDNIAMVNKLLDQSIPEINSGELLIWPETAFDDYSDSVIIQSRITSEIRNSLLEKNVDLLTGVFEIEKDKYYNSIYYLNSMNNYSLFKAEKYKKIKMVPGAESVPFSKTFPFLEKIGLIGNFARGEEYTIFKHKDLIPFAAMVCIESTYPTLSRRMVLEGAEFLVYIANDGWYLNPPEAQQHAKQTIFRAIETRKPILRCGNTGITWVVNSRGEILKSLVPNKKGILTSDDIEVYSNDKKTVYVVLGDWLAYICILVSLCLVLKGVYNLRRK